MNQALSNLFFPYAGIDQIRLYEYDLRPFAEPPQKKRLLIPPKKHATKKINTAVSIGIIVVEIQYYSRLKKLNMPIVKIIEVIACRMKALKMSSSREQRSGKTVHNIDSVCERH
jgi:hypothetical protein